MVQSSCQTNKLFWSTNNSTQTQICVKYDKELQVDLIDDNQSMVQQQQLDQSIDMERIKEEQQSTQRALKEKDIQFKMLKEQMRQAEMQMQINHAQAAEKESAIGQLKDVIKEKDQTVMDLQMHNEKLVERLSNAEQKLFELQDSLLDESKSYRGSEVNKKGIMNESQDFIEFEEDKDDD